MPVSTPVRRRFRDLLSSVALLHAISIGLYYLLDIARQPPARQRLFAWTWMGLTVVVVVVGLQRLKRARRAGRSVLDRDRAGG